MSSAPDACGADICAERMKVFSLSKYASFRRFRLALARGSFKNLRRKPRNVIGVTNPDRAGLSGSASSR